MTVIPDINKDVVATIQGLDSSGMLCMIGSYLPTLWYLGDGIDRLSRNVSKNRRFVTPYRDGNLNSHIKYNVLNHELNLDYRPLMQG
jgi:hypothetical protein